MDDLWYVRLSYATFGVVVNGERVVQAAPIAGWMVGRSLESVSAWIRTKGGWIVNANLAELAMNRVGAEVADEAGCFSIRTSVDILKDARRVGIVGSRDYPELDRVGKLIQLLHPDVYVISGGARGVDVEARLKAQTWHRHVIEITVSGERYTESLFERNTVIVLGSDVICAFWDGMSNGTADTIRKAMHLSGKCIVALPGLPPAVWVERLQPRSG